MNANTQKASIFISTVILICFASSLSLFALFYSMQAMELEKLDLRALKNNETLNRIFANISSHNNQEMGPLDCYADRLKLCVRNNTDFANIINQQEITLLSISNKREFPLLDFNQIFANTHSCSNIRSQSESKTGFGTPLSKVSSIWNKTCALSSDIITDSHKTLYNLETENAFTIPSNLSAGAIIASAGYLELKGQLSFESNLLIIAGGDVLIEKLLTLTGANITIISSSGLISINHIEGIPKMKLISKYGYFLNGQMHGQTSPLLPPLKQSQVISLSNSDD